MITITYAVRLSSLLTTSIVLASLSACSQVQPFAPVTQQVAGQNREGLLQYPASTMIYQACYERWLRNGYTHYTFDVETGTYDKRAEVQRGILSTVEVAGDQIVDAQACSLDYQAGGTACQANSMQPLARASTINDYFTLWQKNPALYQSCHPTLGYPTGFGMTFGKAQKRIDADDWLIISAVRPTPSNQATKQAAMETQSQPQQAASLNNPQIRTASLTEMDVQLVTSSIAINGANRLLKSEFDLANPTDNVALVAVNGWVLDAQYKRYPLFVEAEDEEGNFELKQTQIVEIPAHTVSRVNYNAEAEAAIPLGEQTGAILEFKTMDGTRVNLSLPVSQTNNNPI